MTKRGNGGFGTEETVALQGCHVVPPPNKHVHSMDMVGRAPTFLQHMRLHSKGSEGSPSVETGALPRCHSLRRNRMSFRPMHMAGLANAAI